MTAELGPRRVARAIGALALLLAAALPVIAETIALPGLRGGSLTEAELSQGAHVVVIWASWSPRGRDIAERVGTISDRWGSRARVVAVNFQEERGEVEGFVREHPFSVPVYLDRDGALARKHRITQLPGLLVLVDGVAKFTGALPADPDGAIGAALQ